VPAPLPAKSSIAYLTLVSELNGITRRDEHCPSVPTLWNSLVVSGCKNGRQFLAMVGMIGQHFEDSHLAAGFGQQMVGRCRSTV